MEERKTNRDRYAIWGLRGVAIALSTGVAIAMASSNEFREKLFGSSNNLRGSPSIIESFVPVYSGQAYRQR